MTSLPVEVLVYILNLFQSQVESFYYYHTKFRKDSLINKEILPISKKVHVFLRHPVYASILLPSTLLYESMNILYKRVYVSVCERGYNSLSVCPSSRSSIRLSDQIDGHTNNPSVRRPSVRPSINYPSICIYWLQPSQAF